jgi:hypothetical protein
MKRVTFEIDEALLARAERLAAARGVSVEAMLTELLSRETAHLRPETPEAYRARMEMVEMARKATGGLGGWKWNREELYAERERVSRYERPDLRGDGDE